MSGTPNVFTALPVTPMKSIVLSDAQVRELLAGNTIRLTTEKPVYTEGESRWVKETWAPADDREVPEWIWWRADDSRRGINTGNHATPDMVRPTKWRAPQHLLRCCSRLTVKVVKVKRERACYEKPEIGFEYSAHRYVAELKAVGDHDMASVKQWGCNRCQYAWPADEPPYCPYCGGTPTHELTEG